MSIQTELTRLTNAKAAIKTAIEGKGVTVPDATLLDGMAALIESIEAGGGGSGGTQLAYGTFTPAADTYDYVVTHNLGVMPDFIVVWSSDASEPKTYKGVLAIATSAKIMGKGQWYARLRDSYYYYFADTRDITTKYTNSALYKVNETSFIVFPSQLRNYASAGVTYGYVVIKGIKSW